MASLNRWLDDEIHKLDEKKTVLMSERTNKQENQWIGELIN